jgi:maleate cis-trans isomerase
MKTTDPGTGKRYGYRARIGFIAPGSTLETIPVEFYKIVPDGVVIVFVGIGIKRLTKEDIGESLKGIEKAAAELARTKTDVIILGGSPPVIYGGFGFDLKIIDRIKRVTDIPGTTSQTLAVKALKTMSVRKLVIASPFEENQNALLKKFMEDSGFIVHNIKGLGMERIEYGMLPRDASYHLALEACKGVDDFDGLYMPCAQMPTVEIIDELEKRLGKPVVTSVQGMIWGALKMLGISDAIKGYGRIFQY